MSEARGGNVNPGNRKPALVNPITHMEDMSETIRWETVKRAFCQTRQMRRNMTGGCYISGTYESEKGENGNVLRTRLSTPPVNSLVNES